MRSMTLLAVLGLVLASCELLGEETCADADCAAGAGGVGGDGGSGGGGGKPSLPRGCDQAHCNEADGSCTQHASSDGDLESFEGSCVRFGGTWGSGGCPTAGVVGGCRLDSASSTYAICSILWYTADDYPDIAESVCLDEGHTWIPR